MLDGESINKLCLCHDTIFKKQTRHEAAPICKRTKTETIKYEVDRLHVKSRMLY